MIVERRGPFRVALSPNNNDAQEQKGRRIQSSYHKRLRYFTMSNVFRCLVVALAFASALRYHQGTVNPKSRNTNSDKFSTAAKVDAAVRVFTMEDYASFESMDVSKQCLDTFASPQVPQGSHSQRCCSFLKENSSLVSCLPNLVIMGVQKGGSTALHSFLLLHKLVLPAKKKELHLFDIDRNYAKLSRKLMDWLPIRDDFNRFIVLDSSPSYIADRDACERMSRTLSRDARFVLLLRNPLDRAWSEVKMKRRRIKSQNNFLHHVLPANLKAFARCSLNYLKKRFSLSTFRDCLPDDVAHHGRILAYYKFLMRSARALDFVNTCFQSQEAMKECLEDKYKGVIMNETAPNVPAVFIDEMVRLKRDMRYCCTDDEGLPRRPAVAFYDNQLASVENERGTLNGRRAKLGNEKQDEDLYFDGEEIDRNEGCGKKCFIKSGLISDISKNYLWRSLYYPQLVHCGASIDLERILVVHMEDLKTRPIETVQRILAHAYLPPISDADPVATQKRAHEMFETFYPDFEAVSGWSLTTAEQQDTSSDSEDEMPEDLRRILAEFFRHYNSKLFEFLRIKPFEGWDV